MRHSCQRVLAGLFLLSAACSPGAEIRGAAEPYGTPVHFEKNRGIAFHDFTIRFLGIRKVSHPVFKPGFTYWDFEVKSPHAVQTVSWSSGTGVIDAAPFKMDGHTYELELKASIARKGWLREDEIVVWPEAEFLQAAEAARKRANAR